MCNACDNILPQNTMFASISNICTTCAGSLGLSNATGSCLLCLKCCSAIFEANDNNQVIYGMCHKCIQLLGVPETKTDQIPVSIVKLQSSIDTQPTVNETLHAAF